MAITKLITELLALPFSVLSAASQILTTGALRKHYLIPLLLGIVAYIACAASFVLYRHELGQLIFPQASGLTDTLVSSLIVIVGFVVSGIASILVTIICGAISIEYFVEASLKHYGIQLPSLVTAWGGLLTVARSLVDALLTGTILTCIGIVTLITSFFPVLWVPTFIIGAMVLGWSVFDIVLGMARIPFGERFRLIRVNLSEVIPLGVFISIVSIIPFGSALFLPVVYLLAAKKLAIWMGAHHSPSSIP